MLSTAFDPIFASFAGALPVAYLRALGWRESSLRPTLHDGPAYGILQVVPILLKEWNQRSGQALTADRLLDPSTNTKIAADLLNRIILIYGKQAAQAPNLRMDWGNPEFVRLLTAGWNSGYSDTPGTGVAHVARWLIAHNIPVTHDNVFRYAAQAGGVRWLQEAGRQSWQRSVADLFYQQPDASHPAPSPVPQPSPEGSKSGFLIKATIATVIGLFVAKYMIAKRLGS